jgi:hypothetical protein
VALLNEVSPVVGIGRPKDVAILIVGEDLRATFETGDCLSVAIEVWMHDALETVEIPFKVGFRVGPLRWEELRIVNNGL